MSIPDKFLTHSGYKEKVLFVGQGKHFKCGNLQNLKILAKTQEKRQI